MIWFAIAFYVIAIWSLGDALVAQRKPEQYDAVIPSIYFRIFLLAGAGGTVVLFS